MVLMSGGSCSDSLNVVCGCSMLFVLVSVGMLVVFVIDSDGCYVEFSSVLCGLVVVGSMGLLFWLYVYGSFFYIVLLRIVVVVLVLCMWFDGIL